MANISILGCGWLGLPLAKAFINSGHIVKGSTTTERKLETLTQAGITALLIALHEESTTGDVAAFLKGTDILIIDIPPKLRGESKERFTAKIQNLIPFIEQSGLKKVLFVSSTSVYADDNQIVTEISTPLPDTEVGIQLLESEKLLQGNDAFATTVLRFGGLLGHDRHPVHHLAGRDSLENPDGPVNLIHQEDCIGIIKAIIEKDIWGETFNAAAPSHPSRKEYYVGKAQGLGLPLPSFANTVSKGKIISSDKVTSLLEYQFKKEI